MAVTSPRSGVDAHKSWNHASPYCFRRLAPASSSVKTYTVQDTPINNKKENSWSRLDFLFSNLRMSAYYTNFSITTPEFITFL